MDIIIIIIIQIIHLLILTENGASQSIGEVLAAILVVDIIIIIIQIIHLRILTENGTSQSIR